MTALSSFAAAFLRAADSALAALRIVRVRLARRRFEPLQFLRAGIERREIGGMLRAQRREIVDRDVVFAPRGAQREQPLLDAVELARIVIGGAQRGIEMRARFIERGQRRIERLHGRIDQCGRLRAPPLQPPQRRRERGNRRTVARDRIVRVAQILGDLVGLPSWRRAFRRARFPRPPRA